jgi:hypothetical protein
MHSGELNRIWLRIKFTSRFLLAELHVSFLRNDDHDDHYDDENKNDRIHDGNYNEKRQSNVTYKQ